MIFRLLLMCASFSLFAQSVTTLAVPLITGPTAIFPIDSSQRGADIYKLISTLSTGVYYTGVQQVGIQTTRNGFIPNVQYQNTISAPNGSILIIGYLPLPQTIVQYLIIPVEQITSVIYSITTINATDFSSSPIAGTLPFYTVSLIDRASDIQSVVQTLTTSSTFLTSNSTVNIQTSLAGPYYVPLTNGLIKNVKGITSSGNGTLLIVKFLQTNNQFAYIVVAPDQIFGINYSRTGS